MELPLPLILSQLRTRTVASVTFAQVVKTQSVSFRNAPTKTIRKHDLRSTRWPGRHSSSKTSVQLLWNPQEQPLLEKRTTKSAFFLKNHFNDYSCIFSLKNSFLDFFQSCLSDACLWPFLAIRWHLIVGGALKVSWSPLKHEQLSAKAICSVLLVPLEAWLCDAYEGVDGIISVLDHSLTCNRRLVFHVWFDNLNDVRE